MLAISVALNEARLQGTLAFLDRDGPAILRVYAEPRPNLGGEPEGPLLVEIPLQSPAGVVADNLLTLTPTAEALVAVTGVANWARLVNGAGEFAFDCDVTDPAGTGELTIPSLTLYAGGFTRLVAGVLG